MKKTVVITLGLLLIVSVIAAACGPLAAPEEASAPIEAVPLVVETNTPAAAPTDTPAPTATPEPQPTVEVAEPAPTEVPAVAEPTDEPPTPEPTEEPASAAAPTIFEIVPGESQARFVIDEVLRGSPKTVVGATDQVSGQLAVDPNDTSAAQVGTILVNARTLATDSSSRDRALKNFILQTNTYEYVSFEPAELLGMPDSVTIGEPFSFQIAGNLTVKDLTVPVTFDVTVTPASETRLEGLATLTVPWRDLNLSIPDSPSVDTVEDTVTLELEFVAVPVTDL
ncbi:MAG: YceI family protein [Caldilineales bacterium]